MIDVLDELRSRPKYASSRATFDGSKADVCQRLRINRKPPVPRQFTYLLQSWWPSRRIGPVGEDDEVKRSRSRRRIPEPAQSQYLLWLHRWWLNDITLLFNLRVTRSGLQASDAYTNGANQ